MLNLLEMMEMLNEMNGEHGGSVCASLAMEWLEKGCRKNPISGFQCSADRQIVQLCPIDRTAFLSQLTAFWHCPIDRIALSDRLEGKFLTALGNFEDL